MQIFNVERLYVNISQMYLFMFMHWHLVIFYQK